MPRRLLTLPPNALAALAFALAGLVMLAVAFAVALVIEARSSSVVTERMAGAGMGWVTVQTDGLQVRLSGTAPDESSRFRALNLAGSLSRHVPPARSTGCGAVQRGGAAPLCPRHPVSKFLSSATSFGGR